jgi:hypothetical protein
MAQNRSCAIVAPAAQVKSQLSPGSITVSTSPPPPPVHVPRVPYTCRALLSVQTDAFYKLCLSRACLDKSSQLSSCCHRKTCAIRKKTAGFRTCAGAESAPKGQGAPTVALQYADQPCPALSIGASPGSWTPAAKTRCSSEPGELSCPGPARYENVPFGLYCLDAASLSQACLGKRSWFCERKRQTETFLLTLDAVELA